MPSSEVKRKSSRSINGCWTCRLRRKKCDEQRPSCAICLSHNLPCDGYSEKPADMDGGIREAAYVAKLKEAVHQSMSRRKRRHSRKRQGMTSPTHTPQDSTPETSDGPVLDDQSDFWLSVDDVYIRTDLIPDGSVFNTDTFVDLDICESLAKYRFDQFELLTDDFGSVCRSNSDSQLGDMMTYEESSEQACNPNALSSMSQQTLSTGRLSDRRQSAAVLYYLERGFEQQFGAHLGKLADVKAFVFDLLLHSERFRSVTSILSRLQIMAEGTNQTSTTINQEESCEQLHLDLYYSTEPSSLINPHAGGTELSRLAIIELLFCILQDIHIQVSLMISRHHLSNESLTLMQLYRSNDYSWLDRLSMVANIFHQYPTALNMSLSRNNTDDQLQRESPSVVIGDDQSVQTMSFLVSTFLIFDITASASLKRDPILENHETLIIQHSHMIETISGCDAQIFLAMLSTTRLAIWKHTMLAQRHPDVVELANRASVIKSLLMECLYVL